MHDDIYIKVPYLWHEFNRDADLLASKLRGAKNVYGIPRGGLILAVKLSHQLEIPLITDIDKIDRKQTLVVDEILETGNTIALLEERVGELERRAFLYITDGSPVRDTDKFIHEKRKTQWVIFPWEKQYE